MAAKHGSGSPAQAHSGWKLWVRRVFQVVLIIVVMDGILFLSAGHMDWPGAWLWTLMYFAFLLAFAVWATRNAPDLLKERGRVAANVKGWDKVIGVVYTVLLVVLLITAGLDAGRFRWSVMPFVLQVLGVIGLIPSGGAIWWTTVANAYLSRWARIQDDRGQKVVTGGPYRYVRHPMYLGIIGLFICLPLVLGSSWALIPGGLIGVLYVIRTALEDRMLQEELPGYREYAGRVRYRLLPGVW